MKENMLINYRRYIMNTKLSKIYQEERNKLSTMPCADDDFEALENAINRYNEENKERLTLSDIYGEVD